MRLFQLFRSCPRWLAMATMIALSAPSLAGTAAGSLTASVTLADDCTISINSLSFTTSSALISSNDDTTTFLAVACTSGTAYNIALGAGSFPGATTTARRMTSSDQSSSVAYLITRDAARSQNWGTTVGTDTLAGVGTGTTLSIPVYSRIPSGQPAVPAMTYTDTVTATVLY